MKYFFYFLIISSVTYAQNYNKDTIYINLRKDTIINNHKFKEITISKDNNEINGYIRWNGESLFFRNQIGKSYTLFDLQEPNKCNDVKYFGWFGSLKICNQSKNTFRVFTQEPIASHTSILTKIVLLEYSLSEISLKLYYLDGFGKEKTALINYK